MGNWFDVAWINTFEPTLNPFQRGLLVNYKKVGTRYMGELLSLPSTHGVNPFQLDVRITNQPISSEYKIYDDSHYQLKYEFSTKFCFTQLDTTPVSKFYSNSKEFLSYCGVKNYNELFFENKKDIIFLVRNPLQRFFSGIIQVMISALNEIPNDENLRKEINFYTNLSDSDLQKMIEVFLHSNPNEEFLSKLQKNEIFLFISFLIEKKWNLILQDVHTQNYLFHFVDLIHHINDKTKIKIIDLKDCRSNKSLDFFVELMGNDILKSKVENSHYTTYWESLAHETGTNKSVYNLFFDKIMNSNPNFLNNSSIYHYIKSEFEIYKSLIDSPYFVDLKD